MRKLRLAALLAVVAAVGLFPSAAPATTQPAGGQREAVHLDALRVSGADSRLRTYVVNLDGASPKLISPENTPNVCQLIGCNGTAKAADVHSTVYRQARAVMSSLSLANHTAMMTGAYARTSGIPDNVIGTRHWRPGVSIVPSKPAMVLTPTLFDLLGAAGKRTGQSAQVQPLREIFRCTRDDRDPSRCGLSTDNPEGIEVTHRSPDFSRGAQLGGSVFDPKEDCPADPVSGHGLSPVDDCVMDRALDFIDAANDPVDDEDGEDPDFVFIELNGSDTASHVFWTNSPASVTAVHESDRQLGRLLAHLRSTGKWERSLLLVVSDHELSYTNDSAHFIDPADQFENDQRVKELAGDEAIHVVFDAGGSGFSHLYLDGLRFVEGDSTKTTPPTQRQQQLLARLRALILTHPGVSEAWYRVPNPFDRGNDLATRRPAWGLHGSARVGELVITALASAPAATQGDMPPGENPFEACFDALRPPCSGYTFGVPCNECGPIPGPGTHGQPGTRHNLFVVAGGARSCVRDAVYEPTGKVNEGDDTLQNPGQAETVDVGPTILWAFGLSPKTMPDGRVLGEAFTPKCRPFAAGPPPSDACPPTDDSDNDGLTDSNELLFFTLVANPDSDLDGVRDGNDDANGNGEADEDEDDDDDECPDRDEDGDGTDDEDEDD